MSVKYTSVDKMIKAFDVQAIKDFFNSCGEETIKKYKNEYPVFGKKQSVFNTIDTLLVMAAQLPSVQKTKDEQGNVVEEDKSKEQFEIIKILVENGANVNLKFDQANRTLLMVAVRNNSLGTMKALLSMGADSSLLDEGLKNIVEIGIEGQAIDCLKELNNLGLIDIAYKTILTEQNYLHTACRYIREIEAENVVEFFINLGVDPTAEDYENALPVEYIPEGEDYEEIYTKLENYRQEFKDKMNLSGKSDFDFGL